MKINKYLTTRHCNIYGKRDIKYIVIHYVGAVSTANANARYFAHSNTRDASCHYFVDDTSVWQSISDKNEAWHCGGSLYDEGRSVYGKCCNYNSIGIEMCCVKRNGKLYVTEKTETNTVDLVKYLMKKYNIPASNVVRHWDVTGKDCPRYWTGTSKRWKEFKAKLIEQKKTTTTKTTEKKTVKTSYDVGRKYTTQCRLNVRSGAGTNYTVVTVGKMPNQLKHLCTSKTTSSKAIIDKGSKITCKATKVVGDRTWIKIANDLWICAREENLIYIK